MELPDFYGCNLDALWDAVTGIMYVPANIKIIYKPKSSVSKELENEIEKIVEIFKEAQEEYHQINLTIEK